MLRSLRHRAPTKRVDNETDESIVPGEKGSDRSILKPKACQAIRKHGLSSSREQAVFSKCCLVVLLSVVLITVMILQSTYMMGDGFSSNGGVIGDMADRWILASYQRQQDLERRQGIVFPDVQIKATRRMELAHYSGYLEQILRDHQTLNTSVEPILPLGSSTIDRSPTSTEQSTQSNVAKISGATASFAVSKANDLIHDLRKEGCRSNWLCQRCLNAPYRGSYEACAALCRRCYVRILSTIPGRNDEPIRISGIPEGDRIPKIIHQAWHFYPNSLEYPEISRMMAGWRVAEGYKYYFYNGYDAQTAFVKENYPPLLAKALNAIPSRLSKLSFFRLLVLYKLGGVFADVNLMLETNLDVILDENTTFVASRTMGALDNCLWVNFVAAAPGHPVIARGIENIIRSLILGTHTNSVALERDLMGNSANPYEAELWKLRSQTADYIFKDCSLGLAYNQALGSSAATSSILPTTTHESAHKILLKVDNDAGATRLTDLRSNLLVASSNMVGQSEMSVHGRSINYSKARSLRKQETVV